MNLLKNKKAFFDYFIEDRLTAGIKLEGWEVKALRAKRFSLVGSHVRVKDGRVHLVGMTVDPLPTTGTHVTPISNRDRELLLTREEISKLTGQLEQRGWTLIPLDLHLAHGLIKVELGLATGKKQHDKRETIKQRDLQREQDRSTP